MTHVLKAWPIGFTAVLDGDKTHEIRPADRDYQVGDILRLREFIPHDLCKGTGEVVKPTEHQAHYVAVPCTCEPPRGEYTGRECSVEVRYITRPGTFGLPSNLVVLSIRRTA